MNNVDKIFRVNSLIHEIRNECNAMQTLENGFILSDQLFRDVLKELPEMDARRDDLQSRWRFLEKIRRNLRDELHSSHKKMKNKLKKAN